MKSFYQLLVLAFALALWHPLVVADADADADVEVEYLEPETDVVQVQVSRECAVVLVTGGLIVGGLAVAAAEALVGMLLNVIGFAAIGVEAGSTAAWWQSTFPLVKAGSTFSKLQSITMSEAGVGVVPVGAAVGGVVAAAKIDDLCRGIDSIDSESLEGKTLSTLTLLLSKSEDEVREGGEQANKLFVSFAEKYNLVRKKAGQVEQAVVKEARQGGQWAMEMGSVAVDKVKDIEWPHHRWYKDVKEGGQM